MIGPDHLTHRFLGRLPSPAVPARGTRLTFSTTMMASSTTRPVAKTRPNSVNKLIENPSTFMRAKVPIRDTGMVIAGIKVARASSGGK